MLRMVMMMMMILIIMTMVVMIVVMIMVLTMVRVVMMTMMVAMRTKLPMLQGKTYHDRMMTELHYRTLANKCCRVTKEHQRFYQLVSLHILGVSWLNLYILCLVPPSEGHPV